jgi:hypothetical protein
VLSFSKMLSYCSGVAFVSTIRQTAMVLSFGRWDAAEFRPLPIGWPPRPARL